MKKKKFQNNLEYQSVRAYFFRMIITIAICSGRCMKPLSDHYLDNLVNDIICANE